MKLNSPALSLQRRVSIALAALVSLFVVVQGIVAYLSLEEQEDDLVDELVLTEARRLATQVGGEGSHSLSLLRLSPHFSGWLVGSDGKSVPDDVPPDLLRLSDGPHRPSSNANEVHVYVMPVAGGRLYVQYDATQNEAKVEEFGYYLFGLGTLCILIGIAMSNYIAAVVVAPIERLTRLLSDWAPNVAVDSHPVSDEESRLLDAFSRVQARFEQVLADERAFLANVRHELRTPLTALRTDLEMLLLEPSLNDKARVQRALRTIDGMGGSLELAHTLTHTQPRELASVDLTECVADAWASLGNLPETAGLTLANLVPAGKTLNADRHALLTILRNLMRNAAEHAAPAVCTVSLSARGLEVADNGRGIAAADIAFVFDRYYQGRRSDTPDSSEALNHGLGLAIARQVADLHGWQLWVEAQSPNGTCFVLDLKQT